jgi:uncharacterized membrane protein YoaK (UPF0700 family)
MNQTGGQSTAFGISIGLAFVGGYADASSFLLARTFTGHLTGNCVLAAVSVASKEWHLMLDRFSAVIAFLAGIILSLVLNRLVPVRRRQYSLASAMFIEVLIFLGAFAFLTNGTAPELFIGSMCLALGIQNGALHRTKGISVHSTYMTGMVTTLTRKAFDHYSAKRNSEEDSSKNSTHVTIQTLASMWMTFVLGALAGALMISAFHSIGIIGIVLPLIVLIVAEIKEKKGRRFCLPTT